MGDGGGGGGGKSGNDKGGGKRLPPAHLIAVEDPPDFEDSPDSSSYGDHDTSRDLPVPQTRRMDRELSPPPPPPSPRSPASTEITPRVAKLVDGDAKEHRLSRAEADQFISPLVSDKWLFRAAIGAFCFVVCVFPLAMFVLAAYDKKTPDGIVAFVSAAIAAMAMLVRPTQKG